MDPTNAFSNALLALQNNNSGPTQLQVLETLHLLISQQHVSLSAEQRVEIEQNIATLTQSIHCIISSNSDQQAKSLSARLLSLIVAHPQYVPNALHAGAWDVAKHLIEKIGDSYAIYYGVKIVEGLSSSSEMSIHEGLALVGGVLAGLRNDSLPAIDDNYALAMGVIDNLLWRSQSRDLDNPPIHAIVAPILIGISAITSFKHGKVVGPIAFFLHRAVRSLATILERSVSIQIHPDVLRILVQSLHFYTLIIRKVGHVPTLIYIAEVDFRTASPDTPVFSDHELVAPVEEVSAICRALVAITTKRREGSTSEISYTTISTKIAELLVTCTDSAVWLNLEEGAPEEDRETGSSQVMLDVWHHASHPDVLDLVLTLLVITSDPTRAIIDSLLKKGLAEVLVRLHNITTGFRGAEYVKLQEKILKLIAFLASIQLGRATFRRLMTSGRLIDPFCKALKSHLQFWNGPPDVEPEGACMSPKKRLALRALRVVLEFLYDPLSGASCRQTVGLVVSIELINPKWVDVMLSNAVGEKSEEATRLLVECHECISKETYLRSLIRDPNGGFVEFVTSLIVRCTTGPPHALASGELGLTLALDLIAGSVRDPIIFSLFPTSSRLTPSSPECKLITSILKIMSLRPPNNDELTDLLNRNIPPPAPQQETHHCIPSTRLARSASSSLVTSSTAPFVQNFLLTDPSAIPLLTSLSLTPSHFSTDLDIANSAFRILRTLLLSEACYHTLISTFGIPRIFAPFLQAFRAKAASTGEEFLHFDIRAQNATPPVFAGSSDGRTLESLLSVVYWEASGTTKALIAAHRFYIREGGIERARALGVIDDGEEDDDTCDDHHPDPTNQEETVVSTPSISKSNAEASAVAAAIFAYRWWDVTIADRDSILRTCIEMLLSPYPDISRRKYAAVALEVIALGHVNEWRVATLDADRGLFDFVCSAVHMADGDLVVGLEQAQREIDATGAVEEDLPVYFSFEDDKENAQKTVRVKPSVVIASSPALSTMISDKRYQGGGGRLIPIHDVKLADGKNLISSMILLANTQNHNKNNYTPAPRLSHHSPPPSLTTVLHLLATSDRFLCDNVKKACVGFLRYSLFDPKSNTKLREPAGRRSMTVLQHVVARYADDEGVKKLLEACVKQTVGSLSLVIDDGAESFDAFVECAGGMEGLMTLLRQR